MQLAGRHHGDGPQGRRRRLTVDQYNEKLISFDMKTKIEAAKADIIVGTIKVHDYMSDNSCK